MADVQAQIERALAKARRWQELMDQFNHSIAQAVESIAYLDKDGNRRTWTPRDEPEADEPFIVE